jgi:hypothetical protein
MLKINAPPPTKTLAIVSLFRKEYATDRYSTKRSKNAFGKYVR